MKRAIVKVQNMLLAKTVSQYPDEPAWNLIRVGYSHPRPPDIEFPAALGTLDLFVRFSVFRPGQARFIIRLKDPNRIGQTIRRFGSYILDVAEGSRVIEHSFRLHYVVVPLRTQYTLQLYQTQRSWKGTTLKYLGEEYFEAGTTQ